MEITLVILALVIETVIVFGKPGVEDEGKAYTENTTLFKRTLIT